MQTAINYTSLNDVSTEEKEAIRDLHSECFSDVPKIAIAEDFIAEPIGHVFALIGSRVVGKLDIFKRNIAFDGVSIILGGMGGVCVTENARHKGVATLMLKEGLKILCEEKCDIACLNIDPAKTAHKVYEKIGFQMMEREISFENIHGELIKDHGTMFIPVHSKVIYDLVMNSSETFHYGKGYW